ncbi:MAG: succinylglutamate desuccinylase/aspartoacylase family protein [Candidatus Aminicenantes bacterium]|nr:succinylglutamate desuccinylase/aspartoacylase family protein [Candidatus Aminicenantes bacterium]
MKIFTKPFITSILLLAGTLLLCMISGKEFLDQHTKEQIFPSQGVTQIKYLSHFFPDLKNTTGDSEVYIFQGTKNGGHILILGGTHPNEPASFISALLLVENLDVKQGKVIVIPRANNSAFTHNDPFEGNPKRFSLKTKEGERWFRFGSRLTNPVHQWPDSSIYINPAGQKLSGMESRNLNRCYPGKEHGNLTEKIAFGIMQVIRQEEIDLAIDLHEAAPEYPVINALVFHENTSELAATAVMEAQFQGIDVRLEASPENLRGLCHREWGDTAGIMALLHETANASQGRLKGKTSASLVTEGKDKNYIKAARLGLLFVEFGETGISLEKRVSRHLIIIKSIIFSLQELYPEKGIQLTGYPESASLEKEGFSALLKSR